MGTLFQGLITNFVLLCDSLKIRRAIHEADARFFGTSYSPFFLHSALSYSHIMHTNSLSFENILTKTLRGQDWRGRVSGSPFCSCRLELRSDGETRRMQVLLTSMQRISLCLHCNRLCISREYRCAVSMIRRVNTRCN